MEIQIYTDKEKLQETLDNFIELVEDIPFGNSDFQNQNTIVNGERSKYRAYRHSSLRIISRLNALNETYYSIQTNEIKIKRLKRQIAVLKRKKLLDYDLDIEEKKIEISKIESSKSYSKKLIKDAIAEIKSLEPVIKNLGKITREEFEEGEKEHFREKFANQSIGKNESMLALENMGIDLTTGEYKKDFTTLYEKFNNGLLLDGNNN